MRKAIIHTVILLQLFASYFMANAQVYGDEWVDYNKDYYRISLAQNGIYRITYSDLQNAGFPVSSIDPRRIQLYHRGEEQAILVNGQGDAVFNTTDYIEFYGKRNDGTLDAALYQPSTAQPHQLYNIYSDTSVYFLTYNLGPTNGKRMSFFSENNVGGLPAESSHTEEVVQVNNQTYAQGQAFNTQDVTRLSIFDEGEGWTGALFQEGQSISYTLTGIVNTATSAGTPTLELALVGRDDVTHQAEVLVGPNGSSLRSLGVFNWDNYATQLVNMPIEWSDISNTGAITIRVNATSSTNDRMSVSYIRLFYPQETNVSSSNKKVFNLKPNAGNKSYVELTNSIPGSRLFDITDSNNVRQIGFNDVAGTAQAIVDNTIVSRRLLIISSDGLLTPIVQKADFNLVDAAQYDYIIITHKLLRQPSGGVSDPIAAYADYRSSVAGGGFQVLSIDIDVLYNQYSYGEVSPLAITNFMKFMVNEGNPRYLFLIGKGLDPAINFHRNPVGYIEVTKLGQTYRLRDLVPSVGQPASDIALTAGLNGTSYEPAVPVGRLPAVRSGQVLAYLNKLKETDQLAYDDLWRKELLHLSGGISAFELAKFKANVDGFKRQAESDYLGGKATTIAKQSKSTIEFINVSDKINEGVGMVTFFGHSSPSVIDIDIGFVTDPVLGYNNAGRYPTFLINGCNAGQFFNADILFGEDWILAQDKGALGFIAHTSFGFAGSLERYSKTFYEVAYEDSLFINKSIGEIHKETARRYMASSNPSPLNITQVQQMMLLGDPANSLFGAQLPDFEITRDRVYATSFSDEPINAESDSLALNLIVNNYGRTTTDSLTVNITRILSDNSSIQYDSTFASVRFQDTLVFVINNQIENSFGNNQFMIQLDGMNEINELNETNNTVQFDLFIPLFGTRNLFPLDYAIVNDPSVTLTSQFSDLLSDVRQFTFEIDTTSRFDSPFKKTTEISSRILANWQPGLLPLSAENDSTVYYWRTRFAQPQPGETDEWVTSSFIVIDGGPEGWAQNEYDQIQGNALQGLIRNDDTQQIAFETTLTDVDIITYGDANPATIADISVKLNGLEYNIDNLKRCRDNTVNFIAFDKNTTVPYAAIPLIFQDVRTCGRTPQVINSFTFSELDVGGDDLIQYINDVVDGDSVVMYSIGNPQIASWSAAVKTKMGELGVAVADLDAIQPGEPVVIKGRKGAAPGTAVFFKSTGSPVNEQPLFVNETITGVFASGEMQSVIIGPAAGWSQLITRLEDQDSPATDNNSFSVFGINTSGAVTLLINQQPGQLIDLSMIDPVLYPYLKIQLNTSDPTNLTAPKFIRWQVNYEPAPEGILVPGADFETSVTRQEGEQLSLDFDFVNISNKLFPDSLQVDYALINSTSRTSTQVSKNIVAPIPGDTTSFSVDLKTLGNQGNNDLRLFVNPRITPEQYYTNNILTVSDFLMVEKDNINPILDVLFDGQRIIDGDIVSPSPLISIRLKEENPYLYKTDTLDVNVFIKQNCEGCTFKRVPFSSNEVTWSPASEDQDFKIEYQPQAFSDGTYSLRVEAADVSGNESGLEPYIINFEVINESTITNFYPYPNPFSTSTRFIFTLTGAEIPDEIKIQIMTVSGKVVREITQNELGPIRIGNNVSSFAWDGRDEFGDQLANGVYIYRVLVKSGGSTLKQRPTAADKAFKKGYGKLYLLR